MYGGAALANKGVLTSTENSNRRGYSIFAAAAFQTSLPGPGVAAKETVAATYARRLQSAHSVRISTPHQSVIR